MTYSNRVLGAVDVVLRNINKFLAWVAGIVLGIMTLLVFANVVGRFFFHQPLLGIVELVEMMMAVVGFFAIAYTGSKRGHVTVEVVTARLSKHVRAILGSIAFFISAATIGFIVYQSIVGAIYYIKHLNEASTVLSVPEAPFRLVMALAFLLLCLTLLVDISHPLPTEEEQKEGGIG
jgi:TRAP-type C4-dicarboxylate transport system permease small subunit